MEGSPCPLRYIPQPTAVPHILPEPELCLTPDRLPDRPTLLSSHSDSALDLTPERAAYRHLSTKNYNNPSLTNNSRASTHNTNSSSFNTSGGAKNINTTRENKDVELSLRSLKSSVTSKANNIIKNRSSKSPKKLSNGKKRSSIMKENSTRSKAGAPPVENIVMDQDHCVATFSMPEMNSTLQIAQKMKELRVAEFDLKQTLKTKIQENPELLRAVSSKACDALNVEFHEKQFPDLVPLTFSEAELLNQANEKLAAKMRAVRTSPKPKDPEPDIMDLFPEDLYQECPVDYSKNLTPWTFEPYQADHASVYGFYKRMMARWQLE